MAKKKTAAAVEAAAGNGEAVARAKALIKSFREATPETLAAMTAEVEEIDDEIGELQKQRRGIEAMRKSLAWKINGRPPQTTATEQQARREEIFQVLDKCAEEDGLNKTVIAERTGIPLGGVTTALKHATFACVGRKWMISEEYREKLAEARGR